MRTCRGVLVVFAIAVGLTPIATHGQARADDSGGTAEDAAREIAVARADANAAADAFWVAQSKLDALKDQKKKLDTDTATLEKQVAVLKKSVEALVVNRYIGSGTTGIGLLSGTVAPTEQAQTQVLVDIIDEASSGSLDDYTLLLDQLDASKADAERTTAAFEAAQIDYQAKQKASDDEIARLKVVEKGRLTDEAVQKALEAQFQKAAEAAQKAAAEQQRIDQANSAAAALVGQGRGADGGDETSTVTPINVASESSAGGTTGGGGVGGQPVSVVAPAIYGQGDDWVCPVQGPTAFSDTYGEPRSGGRTHEGVDMISPRGTPIVAVVDGVAVAKQNELGGNTISFDGADGNHYYYAHLDGYETLGDVAKGTVIGIVGDTGNAKFSTPHLHFEIHPGGGPAVDPTPTVAGNC